MASASDSREAQNPNGRYLAAAPRIAIDRGQSVPLEQCRKKEGGRSRGTAARGGEKRCVTRKLANKV